MLPLVRAVDRTRSESVLARYARQINEAVSEANPKAIFSPSSVPLSSYAGAVPAFFWTDAVYPQLIGFYHGDYDSVSEPTLARATEQERSALGAATSAFTSQWAIDAARELSPDAVPRLLGFGPNLTQESVTRIRKLRDSAAGPGIRLFWSGGDWERKGGVAAVRLFELLSEQGIPVELDLVGGRPDGEWPTGVTHHGWLSKHIPSELERLEALMGRATFLVLPSTADCTPIVVSEAAAVGLPVLATDVGGLGETVERFDMGFVADSIETFAPVMAALLDDITPQSLAKLEANALAASASLNYAASFERLFSA